METFDNGAIPRVCYNMTKNDDNPTTTTGLQYKYGSCYTYHYLGAQNIRPWKLKSKPLLKGEIPTLDMKNYNLYQRVG